MQLDEKVFAIDLSPFGDIVVEQEFRNYFLDEPGREHYKLLAYFSSQFNNVNLLDIGSYKGCSALALAYNLTNKVHSFDIGNFTNLRNVPENIKFYVGDVTSIEYIDLIKSSPFIILDTAHDGIFERHFHSHLQNLNWNGVLFLDDIYLNDEMKMYWNEIQELKFDVSEYGHWSGTGLVYFGDYNG